MTAVRDALRRNQVLICALLWAAYLAANNVVNALSVLAEHARFGLPIDAWEPFVWELSSGLFILLLIPAVAAFERRFPLTLATWPRAVWLHLAATFAFCSAHVLGMVTTRKIAYALAGRSYDFGDLRTEFLYEWRKDAITYCLIVGVLLVWRQLRTNRLAAGQEPASPDAAGRFEVKARGRRFWVEAGEIDWIEAAGNYVILHTAAGQHMLRETLKSALARLEPDVFVRVHRSAAVNTNRLSGIDAQAREVQMLSGDRVPVARACWSSLAARLSARNGSPVRP